MRAKIEPSAEHGSVARKSTNVSLPVALVSEAKALGISLSRACERGLAVEINERKAALWLEQNREAIGEWNRHVEAHGLPLACHRQF